MPHPPLHQIDFEGIQLALLAHRKIHRSRQKWEATSVGHKKHWALFRIQGEVAKQLSIDILVHEWDRFNLPEILQILTDLDIAAHMLELRLPRV